jgi:hypothetical protein
MIVGVKGAGRSPRPWPAREKTIIRKRRNGENSSHCGDLKVHGKVSERSD